MVVHVLVLSFRKTQNPNETHVSEGEGEGEGLAGGHGCPEIRWIRDLDPSEIIPANDCPNNYPALNFSGWKRGLSMGTGAEAGGKKGAVRVNGCVTVCFSFQTTITTNEYRLLVSVVIHSAISPRCTKNSDMLNGNCNPPTCISERQSLDVRLNRGDGNGNGNGDGGCGCGCGDGTPVEQIYEMFTTV